MPAIDDDSTLLARYARDRSEQAFGELVQRHLTLVYSAALRRTGGDAHRAKDVAQIVFIRVAREATALSRHSALAGWLYAATRNAAIDFMRTERRRRQREEKAQIMEEILSSPESSADWEQLRPMLDETMDELSARDREALLLRFFEDRPFASVAATLSVSEEAARKRVDRALERLRALLELRGVTSTSGAIAVLLANQVSVAAPASVAASITTTALAAGASAVGGAGVLGAILMSTSKTVTGITALVALAAIGTAVYQTQVVRDTAAALNALGAQRDALLARAASMEQRVKQSDDTLVAMRKELSDLRAGAAQRDATPITRPPASQSGPAMDYVFEHPETHPTFLQQQALRTKARYDRFLAGAGLSAEQQHELLKSMEETEAGDLHVVATLHTHGFGVGNMPKDPEGRALLADLLREGQQAAQARRNRIRELMGDERFEQLQQFSSTIPERNVADEMVKRLYHTETPLTSQQAGQLAQVLAQNRFDPQSTPSPINTIRGTFITPDALRGRIWQAMQQGGMNLLDWPAPITDAAMERAKGVLSPAQFETLQHVQALQLTQFQLAPPPPPPDGK